MSGDRAGDLWGGLAAALVALPSSIAFGVVVFTAISPTLAGAGALAGVLGAAALGVVAPLVGKNAGLITAPCAPAAAVLSAVAVTMVGAKAPTERVLGLLALTALVSAALQAVYGLLRAGRLIKFIPYQVVSGYLSGVALIIATAQLPRLLGAPSGATLWAAVSSPSSWRWQAIVVGLLTVAVMLLAPKLTTKVPGAILGLAAGVLGYLGLGLLDPNLYSLEGNALVVGALGDGGSILDSTRARISSLATLRPSDLREVLGPALTLSVLLSIDTLKTGVVLDAMTRQRTDPDRALLGQGAANAVAFLVGGLPGAGTSGPTLVNIASGGRSIHSGVFEGLFVLLAFLALAHALAYIPVAALAGILLVVAARMFDRKMFGLLRARGTRLDFAVIAVVIVIAETVGLIQASATGVGLAILLFIREQIRGSVIVRKVDLRELRSKRRRSPTEAAILREHGGEATSVQLQGELFFGTTDQLFTDLEAELSSARYILFDLRRVRSIDYTAAHLLSQMRQRLVDRGGELLFSGMPSAPGIAQYLRETGLLEGPEAARVFETRDGALEWMEESILARAGCPPPEDRALELGELALAEGLDPAALERLSELLEARGFAKGERVFQSKDPGAELFLVRRGRVHILLPLAGGKRHHLATCTQGEFFGEMAFLDRAPRSADAEAAIDSELYVLSRERFDELSRTDPALFGRILDRLALAIAQRLRGTDAELSVLEDR